MFCKNFKKNFNNYKKLEILFQKNIISQKS